MRTRSGKKYRKSIRRVRYQSHNSVRGLSKNYRKKDFTEEAPLGRGTGTFKSLSQDSESSTPVRALIFTEHSEGPTGTQLKSPIEAKSPRRVPRSRGTRVEVHSDTPPASVTESEGVTDCNIVGLEPIPEEGHRTPPFTLRF